MKIITVNNKPIMVNNGLVKSVGIVPSGTLNITENGDYDVTDKASAAVNVQISGSIKIGASNAGFLRPSVYTGNGVSYPFKDININCYSGGIVES